MSQRMTGGEPGLAALWYFENVENGVVRDAGPNGFHGKLVGNAKTVEEQLPQPPTGPQAGATVNVLDLDGKTGHVELPPRLFTNEVVTVEGWVKWRQLNHYSRFFQFSDAAVQLGVMNEGTRFTLLMERYRAPGMDDLKLTKAPNGVFLDQWVHVAAVAGTHFSKLHYNGLLISTNETAFNFKPGVPPGNFLGWVNWNTNANPPLDGQVAEVRLWAGERTVEQIKANMLRRLGGREPGLLALWNFADGTAKDATTNGRDGILRGTAKVIAGSPPITGQGGAAQFTMPSIIHGKITDEAGNPIANVNIQLEQEGREVAQIPSNNDQTGQYSFAINPSEKPYDIGMTASANNQPLSAWESSILVPARGRMEINWVLRNATLHSGTVYSLDTNQPLSGIVEQTPAFPSMPRPCGMNSALLPIPTKRASRSSSKSRTPALGFRRRSRTTSSARSHRWPARARASSAARVWASPSPSVLPR